jgi:hypothetical protein
MSNQENLCQQAIELWQEKQATLAVEATVLDVPVTKARVDRVQINSPIACIIKSAVRYIRNYTPLEKREEYRL